MSDINPCAIGVVKLVQAAASRRAATYRERAAHFGEMAAAEPIGRVRDQLLALAMRYEELAADLEPSWSAARRDAGATIRTARNWPVSAAL